MPSTPEAVRIFLDHKLLYAPGKAANAGGVSHFWLRDVSKCTKDKLDT